MSAATAPHAGRLARTWRDRLGWSPNTVTATAVAVAVIGSPIGLAWGFETFEYDIWGAFVWGPILLLALLPLCRWVARRAGEPELVLFLMGAAVLKVIVGPLARYASARAFYGGLADAARYDNAASELVDQFRGADLSGLGEVSGTRFLEVLTGVVQAVIGETRLGTFLVFSAMGFVGMLLLYLAFCESLPDGGRTLYRRLLFLTPSIWFWPSSIGKEAFMLLCLGGATYGAARLLHGHLLGLLPAALGVWGMLVVRPHVALVLFAGLLLAVPTLARHRASNRTVSFVVVPILVLVALPLVVSRVEAFFDIESLDVQAAEDLYARVEDRTAIGGSAVEAGGSFTPGGLLSGSVSVVARPYLWEADGGLGAAASLEATGVVVLVAVQLWRNVGGLALWIRRRYVRLAVGYTVAFAAAFSTVSNLGILSRQRSLLLPLLFVVIALPHQHQHQHARPHPEPDT